MDVCAPPILTILYLFYLKICKHTLVSTLKATQLHPIHMNYKNLYKYILVPKHSQCKRNLQLNIYNIQHIKDVTDIFVMLSAFYHNNCARLEQLFIQLLSINIAGIVGMFSIVLYVYIMSTLSYTNQPVFLCWSNSFWPQIFCVSSFI